MSIYGRGAMAGGGRPIPLNVSHNSTWTRDGGYSPVKVSVTAETVTSGSKTIAANGVYDVTEFKEADVNVPASAVTSGTVIVTAEGNYDVTNFKNVMVDIGAVFATTSPVSGVSYVDGLPNDWYIMKEIGMAISEASDSINANTTGSIYVNKENKWAYKITPGNTINVTSQIGTYTYAVMGFNNFYLSNLSNYGGTHHTAGLTFGAVDCVGRYQMNSNNSNNGGWGECQMRTVIMPTLQSGMPDTLAQVKVPYVNRDSNTERFSKNYMFLPAEKEVFGTYTYSPTTEANALTQFAYYKNGGSKIKSLSGSAVWWWLRTVNYNSSSHFCGVGISGGADFGTASVSHGAAPCFCV